MNYSLLDILLTLIYFGIIILIAKSIARKRVLNDPEYKFYTKGLAVKLLGGISLCLIYTYYYNGGDTTAYYRSAVSLGRLLFKNPKIYFSIITGNLSIENYSYFNRLTGWPAYFNDPQSFSVVRFVSPFTLLGLRSYMPTTLLIALINYSGIWRLYRLFVEKFPGNNLRIAIAALFMPSVFFWGSGILKDSFTISAAGWFVFSYYRILINRKRLWFYILTLIISSYVLISIKPYIFFSILIGLAIWYTAELVNRFKNMFLRTILSPLIIVVVWGAGSLIMMYFGSIIGGAYSNIDTLIEKAIVTQDDLKKEYYHGNSYDIGQISPTIGGIISKYPEAVTAGLFRPFIWEARNPVMFLAGLENLFLLLLTIYLIIKVGLFKIIKYTLSESLLLSSLVFSLSFAFSIGLSTSNFGALVRYKIPLVPFFVAYLLVIYSINKQYKQLAKKTE